MIRLCSRLLQFMLLICAVCIGVDVVILVEIGSTHIGGPLQTVGSGSKDCVYGDQIA